MAAPRLLLFGPPDAGKSALLKAIVQSAPSLKAELVSKSDAVEHFHVKPEKVSGPFLSDVTVLDCSGKSALEMLQAEEPFARWHPMRRPILEADAVVLAVDVSTPKKQMNEDFRQAARWLKHLHEYRGKRADIADLAVYVVLTKCDRLGKKDDTAATWANRIEDAKRMYLNNFNKYLKPQEPGFGTIKLKVVATSTQPPAFADRGAQPFGIAELFQDCLQSAADFQERRQTSQGRLQNLLVGLVSLIALLGLTLLFLVEYQPTARTSSLEEKLRVVLPKPEASVVERLQGSAKKLEDREKKLVEIEEDADFKNLPSATRTLVTDTRRELAQYVPLLTQSQTIYANKLPYHAGNDADLAKLEKSVKDFALPEAKAAEWEQTVLGQRIRQMRKEFDTLRSALKDEEKWLREQIAKNDKLNQEGPFVLGNLLKYKSSIDTKARDEAKKDADRWIEQYDAQQKAEPTTPRIAQVPGVSLMFYKDLGKFEPVKKAQADWKTSSDNLRKINDLIQAELASW